MIEAIVTGIYSDELELVDTYAGRFGAVALVMLLFSFICIASSVYSFLKMDREQFQQKILITIIISCLISVIYAIVCIVSVESLNADYYELAKRGDNILSTSAWAVIIVQAVLLLAYILCDKYIPVKEEDKKTISKEATQQKSVVQEEKVGGSKVSLETLIKDEMSILEALKGYFDLYKDEIISSADFIDKKNRLLRYSEISIKLSIKRIQKTAGVVGAEKVIVSLIRNYKQLLDEEIITSAEFLNKKGSLMEYII